MGALGDCFDVHVNTVQHGKAMMQRNAERKPFFEDFTELNFARFA